MEPIGSGPLLWYQPPFLTRLLTVEEMKSEMASNLARNGKGACLEIKKPPGITLAAFELKNKAGNL